jgi:hypothetical protein
MARPIHTYVDIEFLRGFYKARPKDELDPSGDFQVWQDLQLFLAYRTDITFSKHGTNLKDLSEDNPLARLFVENALNGSSGFACVDIFQPIEPKDFLDVNPNCTFILRDSEDKSFDAEGYGVVATNSNAILSTWKKFARGTDFHVDKVDGNFTGFQDLLKFRSPVNSIVITDNYILSQRSKIKANILEILTNLIPKRKGDSKFPLEVMIVTCTVDGTLPAINSLITEHLKKELRSAAITVSIVKIKQESFHDRLIFSHFFYFESGQSFNYCNEMGKIFPGMSTSLKAFPLPFSPSGKLPCADMAKKRLRKLARVVNDCLQCEGPKTNRLLDIAMRK